MVYGKKWSIIFNDSTPEDPYIWLFPYAIMNYAKYNLDYNNKSEIPYKRKSLMFYVACYFRLICNIYYKIGVTEEIAPVQIKKEQYQKVFDNEQINIKILDLVDSVIRFFMKDGLIKDIIKMKYGQDEITNFMKLEVETNENVRMRLDEIINGFLIENPTLIKEIESLFD